MQSNIDCIMDDLNEFPDSWVELYNTSDSPVNLKKYNLGIEENVNKAWALPDTMINARSFVIVYCDKVGADLHTDFRLESGKGNVYLYNEGLMVENVSFKKQPAPNVAYGRIHENSQEWGYQIESTPGNKNCGTLAKDILAAPVFSKKGFVSYGVGDSSFDLILSKPSGTPSASVIRYTTDGSEPTNESSIYTEPLSVTKTQVIRAKMYCKDYLPSVTITHSYIWHFDDTSSFVTSICTNPEYLYSDSIGIFSHTVYRNDSLNWKYKWRRPANIEYFGKEGGVNQLCEMRVFGGGSRQYPLKSMLFYANKRFGEKRFYHEFFPKQRPGKNSFASIVLRNSGSDFTFLYMRDVIIQSVMSKYTDIDYQAFTPTAVYINGVYKGLVYVRERSTEGNILSNYGIEDIDMIENWYDLKTGDWENFILFKNFYSDEIHSLDEYEEWMDIEEYANYMIMELFVGNRDFPNNNIVMWRPRTDGGKWRWIAKDLDFGLGLYDKDPNYNMIPWFYGEEENPSRRPPLPDQTLLFRNLMKNEDFFNMFIERSAIYMGDFMNHRGYKQTWDSIWVDVEKEYYHHRALYEAYDWIPYNDIREDVNNWLLERPACFMNHLNDYYNVGEYRLLEIQNPQSNVKFGEHILSSDKFEGFYWVGHPIILSTLSESSLVEGWIVTIENKGETITNRYSDTTLSIQMPDCEKLTIQPLFSPSSIHDINPCAHCYISAHHKLTVFGKTGEMVQLFSLRGELLARGRISELGYIEMNKLTNEITILQVGTDIFKIL